MEASVYCIEALELYHLSSSPGLTMYKLCDLGQFVAFSVSNFFIIKWGC